MKIAIVGYGNLGRGVEAALTAAPDMTAVGIFTRRDPASVQSAYGVPVYHMDALADMADGIDVVINCGGSATDLPTSTPALAEKFHVIDSFDTHANILAHRANVDKAARKGGKVAIISVGWDPGMFSVNRLYAQSILPNSKAYTFWGTGVSQGHSDAIRRIEGVADARQYTVPVEDAVARVRAGEMPDFKAADMHERVCYVALKQGADAAKVEQAIVTMPNYFAPYKTTVHFVSLEELHRDHAGLPHGGKVIVSGNAATGSAHTIEYALTLESNPDFTGSVLVAFARAAYRLGQRGEVGCKTAFDIVP
ncbi:MAG: diaminopimelate dehydrogenase, partial [Clostridia bacterium]|nr:diaminopimelate dehydrogenase [Clostridia bacterium]